MIIRIHIVFVLLVFLLGGCAVNQASQRTTQPAVIDNSALTEQPEENTPYIKELLESIEKRNLAIEKDPHWIKWSYSGIGIKKLNNIPAEKYPDYSKFMDNGMIYIIVHPAYFVFFHNNKPVILRTPDNFDSSIVDIFLKDGPDNRILKLVQQQQRNEKNFIEQITTDGKLVMLVLPKDYNNHPSYPYGSGTEDEYARYINEITNGSGSAIYIESSSPTGGKLLTNDLIMLLAFLGKIGAKSVLVGGGYVGRCQEEFYNYVSSYSATGNYFIVPEISIFSPEDLSEKKAESLSDGEKINFQAASEFIISRTFGNVNLQHLSRRYIKSLINPPQVASNEKGNLVDIKNENNPVEQTEKIDFLSYICSFCFTNSTL